jgi:toxin ParE1/3/4
MARIVVSATANADITGILAHLAVNTGRQIAARYAADFDALYDRLADFPDIGPPRPTLGPNVRISFLHPYALIYRHIDDTVTVLRVLHGKRDITPQLVTR